MLVISQARARNDLLSVIHGHGQLEGLLDLSKLLLDLTDWVVGTACQFISELLLMTVVGLDCLGQEVSVDGHSVERGL